MSQADHHAPFLADLSAPAAPTWHSSRTSRSRSTPSSTPRARMSSSRSKSGLQYFPPPEFRSLDDYLTSFPGVRYRCDPHCNRPIQVGADASQLLCSFRQAPRAGRSDLAICGRALVDGRQVNVFTCGGEINCACHMWMIKMK